MAANVTTTPHVKMGTQPHQVSATLVKTCLHSPLRKKKLTAQQTNHEHTKRKVAVIEPKLHDSRVTKRQAVPGTQPQLSRINSTQHHSTHRSTHHPGKKSPEPPSAAGFEAAVLGGELWCAPCRAASQTCTDAIGSVPLRFTSAKHYVETFEPLLFAEARASLLADWAEGMERHTAHTAKVLRLRRVSTRINKYMHCVGMLTNIPPLCCSASPASTEGLVVTLELPPSLATMANNALVLMMQAKPPRSNVQAWLSEG